MSIGTLTSTSEASYSLIIKFPIQDGRCWHVIFVYFMDISIMSQIDICWDFVEATFRSAFSSLLSSFNFFATRLSTGQGQGTTLYKITFLFTIITKLLGCTFHNTKSSFQFLGKLLIGALFLKGNITLQMGCTTLTSFITINHINTR